MTTREVAYFMILVAFVGDAIIYVAFGSYWALEFGLLFILGVIILTAIYHLLSRLYYRSHPNKVRAIYVVRSEKTSAARIAGLVIIIVGGIFAYSFLGFLRAFARFDSFADVITQVAFASLVLLPIVGGFLLVRGKK